MFERDILYQLEQWAEKPERKPLILRGARQVGKTTAVELFSGNFDKFIKLNLELKRERELFEHNYSADELVTALHLYKNMSRGGKTLLFIDEIQNSPEAVAMLRYLYEETSDIYVIAAGSLLESLLNIHISFPVGRVEYLLVHPCSFQEFLKATGEKENLSALRSGPVPAYAHHTLYNLFRTFTLIGGMPEIVHNYASLRDITGLATTYEGLITSYLDDVEKYASGSSMTNIIRHVIRNSFTAAGSRIKFEGFGNSNYRSREVGEAFRILEKTLLLQLVYPTASVTLPVQPDIKKSPKLQVLDTGLINYIAGLQLEVFGSENIDSVYNGKIAEHIAGQEILALNSSPLYKLNFWTRENKDSNAEVDFVYKYNDMLIPLEVKSGPAGRLRSLHQFVDRAPHPYAVRLYSGMFSIENHKTLAGKSFFLLNLPFYLLSRIDFYLSLLLKHG